MSRPVLASALLAVMAGAWYWALKPVAPSLAGQTSSTSMPGPAGPRVPVVRIDQLTAQAANRPVQGDWRNPFGDSTPSPSVTRAPAPALAGAAVTPASAAPPPTWPRLELIGLAEATHEGGLVRTAIVSGPHGVLHAQPGDLLEGVYRLERIGVDGVEVRLLPEDRIVRVPLRR